MQKDSKQARKNWTIQTANVNDTMLSHMALTYETKMKREIWEEKQEKLVKLYIAAQTAV